MFSPSVSPAPRFYRSLLLVAASLAACEFVTVWAADTSTVSLAEKEIQRRMLQLGGQMQQLEAADKLLREGQSAAAYTAYEAVYQAVPDIETARGIRAVALEGYLRSGLIQARERVNAGDYPAATKILDTLDRPGVAKGDRGIQELRALMNDPDRFPPSLTPDHIKNVGEVQRLLTLAASQHETGMYDRALQTYEDVLRIDATNSAARRGMERVERERDRYFATAKDQQRSRMLNGVSELWEDKPRLSRSDITTMFGGATAGAGQARTGKTGKDTISAKLHDLRVEKVDFTGATLEEVIEYLKVRSRDIDPTGKGIDFVLSLPSDTPMKPISLNLIDVPVEEVLRYATEVAGLSYRIEEFAVRIVSSAETNTALVSKTYRVPPNFLANAAVDPASAPAPADPFAPQAAAGATGIQRRMGAKEYLESQGITFPEGSGANYNPVSNMLIVRNTVRNLESVDAVVEQALSASPKMAVIEVKLVEINQTKLDEMSFDWLLGGFGSPVQLGGGTTGNQLDPNFVNSEFPTVPGLNPTQLGPVTAGLRSSPELFSNLSVEDVLVGAVQPTAQRSPGILSLAGVFTDPQFQVAWRGLNNKTGVDLVSKPSVITKSGQKATIENVREFIYPTEFDPPQIPTNVGGANNNAIIVGPTSLPPIPVTPTTPTAFETRRVGMVLDVEPLISEDGRSIDLTITPEFTEFLGFVNYGSPINSVSPGVNSGGVFSPPSSIELTPNRILQPIFTTKKVTTAVKVYDGATVVLGGLISDNSVMMDDHVPVIGTLPVVGKFFSSKVKQRRMKNIIMFVSVKVVDPSGNRVNPQ